MLPHGVNAIVEMQITTEYAVAPGQKFLNRLRYRATAGQDNTTFSQWEAALIAADFQRFYEMMPENYYCSHLKFELIFPTPDAPLELGYAFGDALGTGNTSYTGLGGTADPAMCAVVTRKSTRPGRARIGHVYWGPLAVDYDIAGYLDPAPGSVLVGDLQQVLDFLGDPLTVAGVQYKPCVVPNQPVSVNSNDDVVDQYWAAKVVQRHSRRPGIGM